MVFISNDATPSDRVGQAAKNVNENTLGLIAPDAYPRYIVKSTDFACRVKRIIIAIT